MQSSDVNKLNDIELSNNGVDYLMEYRGRFFKINKYIYDFITTFQHYGFSDINRLCDKLNLSIEEFDYLSKNIIDKCSENRSNSFGAINGKITILNRRVVNIITYYFKRLLPGHFKLFLVLFSCLLLLFAYISHGILKTNIHSSFITSPLDLVLLYTSIITCSIFHEIGHAAASKKFTISPGEIGFGFFFIFPVFFSNVSSIWKLDKFKRIIVNLSGIYFQILFSLVTIAFINDSVILKPFILANIAMISFSLLPFLKNDGYWVLSDYLDIKNLYSRSYSYFLDLINGRESFNIYMFLYTLIHISFVLFLSFNFSKFFIKTTYLLINTDVSLTFNYVFKIIKYLFNLIIIYSLITRIILFFKIKKHV